MRKFSAHYDGKGMKESTYQFIKENLHLLDIDLKTGEIKGKKFASSPTGYQLVYFSGKTSKVHQVIAIAGGLDPRGKTINHKNGDKSDNSFANLEIQTISENWCHAVETGLIDYTKRKRKLNRDIVLNIKKDLAKGESIYVLGDKYGVHFTTISDVKRGKTWSHVKLEEVL